MKILRKAKENLFIIIVTVLYVCMFAIRPDTGLASVKNSVYYIREMIMIMPVVFVLTALLDAWVPKEQIMRFLGKEAGIKGAVFALVLGSISAGPIYAAFPLCVMLHKKGASIRNLVVILSAWAVIKVPMLLNELKFLGFKFMAVRWVLTVLAIFLFSWITAKFVRDGDLPNQSSAGHPHGEAVRINKPSCMGCSLCVRKYPALFGMESGKAYVKNPEGSIDTDKLALAASACPVKAVVISGDF